MLRNKTYRFRIWLNHIVHSTIWSNIWSTLRSDSINGVNLAKKKEIVIS
jgi:hypothetical protein